MPESIKTPLIYPPSTAENISEVLNAHCCNTGRRFQVEVTESGKAAKIAVIDEASKIIGYLAGIGS